MCVDKKIKSNINSKQSGFTIIELLVVIVIIGILAVITIVSYTGITKKANEANLISDLASAKKQVALYYTEHGVYPKSLGANNCLSNDTVTPNPDTNYCLKSGSGNIFVMTPGDGSTFELTASKGTLAYKVTENTPPTSTIPVIPITSIAATSGTPLTGQTLTAGALTPSEATASYKWQSSTTVGGAYTDIPGAT